MDTHTLPTTPPPATTCDWCRGKGQIITEDGDCTTVEPCENCERIRLRAINPPLPPARDVLSILERLMASNPMKIGQMVFGAEHDLTESERATVLPLLIAYSDYVVAISRDRMTDAAQDNVRGYTACGDRYRAEYAAIISAKGSSHDD